MVINSYNKTNQMH